MSHAYRRMAALIFQSTPPARGATTVVGERALPPAFQSTPPARGATVSGIKAMASAIKDFNPRPPRGGRPRIQRRPSADQPISIHAPREGGDAAPWRRRSWAWLFQSTPPARGATAASTPSAISCRFQSTPPARGATADRLADTDADIFQSTPPARGATGGEVCPRSARGHISIHAPREGGDYLTKNIATLGSISIHAPREGGDSKDAQFYPRIFDK